MLDLQLVTMKERRKARLKSEPTNWDLWKVQWWAPTLDDSLASLWVRAMVHMWDTMMVLLTARRLVRRWETTTARMKVDRKVAQLVQTSELR